MKNKVVKQRNDTSSKRKFAKSVKLEPKKATKGVYNSIEYDSLDELAILQWLFELKRHGYIKHIKRADSYLLSNSLVNNYAESVKKVSSKPCVQTLLHGHSYTPEFKVIWDYKKSCEDFVWDFHAESKFDKIFIGKKSVEIPNEFETYIEVKPSFDQNNMERLFKLNQKWMWDKHGIFVNLIKVKDLFPTTFTPKEYLTTPTGRRRVLKWKPKNVYQFTSKK